MGLILSNVRTPRPGPGLLTLLQAFVAGFPQIDPDSLPADVVSRALDNGLGPILARVCGTAVAASRYADPIQAADLTARLLTAEMLDSLAETLGRLAEAGCRPTLLKGTSTCVRYYPEPHLRTMGDVDLLIRPDEWSPVERLLRADGFEDAAGVNSRAWYEQHHHSIPLSHAQRRLYIELHTRLYPPSSPMVTATSLSPEAVETLLTSINIGASAARVFTHELQLVYTATRWAEMPSLQRGMFPILDAALLIALHGASLDWPRVCALVDGTWGTTALRLLLTYIDRWQLAPVPTAVLRHLARADQYTNAALIDALHHLVTTYVMVGRPLGRVVTSRNWRTAWSEMVGPTPRWRKPLRLAFHLAFRVSERDKFTDRPGFKK